MSKQYDTTWEGGGVFPKKYHISIEGEGTAEEVLESIKELWHLLDSDYDNKKEWGNNRKCSLEKPDEWFYSDDGILRTEVIEINE